MSAASAPGDHTFKGKRGGFLIAPGLSMREIYEIVYDRVYYIRPKVQIDIDALCQNICCEIEKRLGVFPNITPIVVSSDRPDQADVGVATWLVSDDDIHSLFHMLEDLGGWRGAAEVCQRRMKDVLLDLCRAKTALRAFAPGHAAHVIGVGGNPYEYGSAYQRAVNPSMKDPREDFRLTPTAEPGHGHMGEDDAAFVERKRADLEKRFHETEPGLTTEEYTEQVRIVALARHAATPNAGTVSDAEVEAAAESLWNSVGLGYLWRDATTGMRGPYLTRAALALEAAARVRAAPDVRAAVEAATERCARICDERVQRYRQLAQSDPAQLKFYGQSQTEAALCAGAIRRAAVEEGR